MQFYIVVMMSGSRYKITESEYQSILTNGSSFIPRIKCLINKSSISDAYPENSPDMLEDKRKQMTGVLHDGTHVKRHFGEWVDSFSSVPDDKGNYQPVRLDPKYYPEVARDCVPTEKEFEKIKSLPTEERLRIILGDSKPRELEGGKEQGFTKIGNALQQK